MRRAGSWSSRRAKRPECTALRISAFAVAFVAIGFAMLVVTTIHGGGVVGYVLGAALHRGRSRAPVPRATALTSSRGAKASEASAQARRARLCLGVAYGEIACSIYFALGIIAAHALGLHAVRPAVHGGCSSSSSRSRTRRERRRSAETGGAATFVRRAFNDLAGFVAGWALFLDYLIVTALAALFLPHYLGAALGLESLESGPWDLVVALARHRRHRRRASHTQARSCTRPASASPRSTSSRRRSSWCWASPSCGRRTP